MKLLFRKIGQIGLAVLLVFSTTGVTIYHHICGCPAPVPRVVQETFPVHSCCPVTETPPGETCCSDREHDRCDAEHHQRCKNEVIYLKAPMLSTMPVSEVTVSIACLEISNGPKPEDEFPCGHPGEQQFVRPVFIPPRAGGSLVIFLHSIKIPFPEEIA